MGGLRSCSEVGDGNERAKNGNSAKLNKEQTRPGWDGVKIDRTIVR